MPAEEFAQLFHAVSIDTVGCYMGQRLGEWSAKYGSSATRVKRYAAKAVRYFSKIGVAEEPYFALHSPRRCPM